MRAKVMQIWGKVAFALAGVALAASWTSAQAPAPAQTPKAPAAASAAPAGSGIRFTATTENAVGAHNSIRIDLMRWSSDVERDQLPTVWTQALARAAAVAAGRGGAAAGGGGRGGRGGRGGGGPGGGAADDDPNGLNDPTPSAGPARPLTPEGSLAAALEKAPTLGYVWASSEISGCAVRYGVRLPQSDGGEKVILITDRRLGNENDLWNPVASDGKPGNSATGGGPADNKYEFSVIEMHFSGKGLGEGKISMTDKITVDAAAKVIDLASYADLPVVLKNVERKTLGKS
jgi:hypothetical protein